MERAAPVMVLALLFACDATDYGTGPEVWSDPVPHEDESFLFDHSRINRVDITLDLESERILRRERVFTSPRNEVQGRVTIDGEEIGWIGVRLRGGLGSFNRYDDKPKWELDFNEVSGERFHGLESLSLNNANADCSGARDHLAFFANGLAGVPTSRTGNVQLFVNGLDYGMFIALETQDDRWLKHTFTNNNGNFYDGGYVQAGPWPLGLDFGRERDSLFDLEEGVDIGAADITAISDEVEESNETGEMSDTLWALVDWDRLLRKFAVEEWTQNTDAYLTGANNYRLYFQTDGPMVMTPWDQDGSFPYRSSMDDRASSAKDIEELNYAGSESALAAICAHDAPCLEAWSNTAHEVANALEQPEVLAFVENFIAVTSEGWLGDPRQTCTQEAREEEWAYLSDFVQQASGDLREIWPRD